MSQRKRCNADDIEKRREEEEEDDNKKKNKGKRKGLFGGCSYKRAKKMVFSPFNKVYTRFNHTRSYSSSPSSSHTKSPPVVVNSNSKSSSSKSKSKKGGGGGKFYCCLCLSKPQTLETSVDDDCDDPYEESLQGLIEKNEFYSKECNTHFGD